MHGTRQLELSTSASCTIHLKYRQISVKSKYLRILRWRGPAVNWRTHTHISWFLDMTNCLGAHRKWPTPTNLETIASKMGWSEQTKYIYGNLIDTQGCLKTVSLNWKSREKSWGESCDKQSPTTPQQRDFSHWVMLMEAITQKAPRSQVSRHK